MKQNIVLFLSKEDIEMINWMSNINDDLETDDTLRIPLYVDSICKCTGARPAYFDTEYQNEIWEQFK